MVEKRTIQLTVKQLVEMVKTGSLSFVNNNQNGVIWKRDRQTMLIFLVINGYSVAPISAVESDGVLDGKKLTIYDCFDGKKYNEALRAYLNNEFALEGFDEIEPKNGEFPALNGMYFKDLPEELKDRICNHPITLNSFRI